MRDNFDILPRLLPRDSFGERDVEALSLPDGGDGLVAEPVQGRADGLPLRVQYRGFEGNEDASFHGNFDYRMAMWRRLASYRACADFHPSGLALSAMVPRWLHNGCTMAATRKMPSVGMALGAT